MLRSYAVRVSVAVLLAAAGATADPALYWGSHTAVTGGVAASPDLVGPDGGEVPSGSDWLLELVDLGSGNVLSAAPAGAIMALGQEAPYSVFYATLAEAGPWRGYAVGTRVFNSASAATATRWAMFSNTMELTWNTVPCPPATFTYDAGQVTEGDWQEFHNLLAPASQTTCVGSAAPIVVPLDLAVDQDLCLLSFVLEFDPARLRAVSYRAAGRTAVAAQADGIDQANGRITFSFGQVDGASAIAAGTGLIAEAVFELQPDVGATRTALTLGSVEARTLTSASQALSARGGGIEVANCSLYTLTYQSGGNGSIDGPTPQTVSHGADGTAVTAVPAFGYCFDEWSDGSSANPRQDLHVTASQTQTASFQASDAVPPTGDFRARVVGAESAERGLWDLTGTYTIALANQPLTLRLLHEPSGRLGGTATYSVGPTTVVSLSVRGSVKTASGCVTLKGSLAGTDPARIVTMALALCLTVDPVHLQLVGQISGSSRSGGLIAPLVGVVTLAIAPPMDGAWALGFQLERVGRAIAGTARLTLANGVDHACAVKGRVAGQTAVLDLAGDPADPASKAIRIRTTITPLEGGWARLEALSGNGYGQSLVW